MSVYDIGRVCIKTRGREANYRCVVLNIIDKNNVLVEGLKVKRRACNIKHLAPTKDKLEISKEENSENLKKAIEKAKMTEAFEKPLKL